MKRLATLILVLLSLTTLLVPGIVLAEEKGGKTLTDKEKYELTERAGLSPDLLNKIIKAGGFCLTLQEKTDYITTVLETPLDSADDTALYEANDGVIDNGDGTMTKRCARFTQILNLRASGDKKEKTTDQYLIKKCPPESDIPDGYGEQTSEGDTKGNFYDCQEVTVIMSTLEQGGIGVLNVYVSLIYRWVAGIIGVVAVLIIIVSGLQIITAQGESSAIEEGKKRIIQSIGGIVLLFFASGLLYMINPTFFNPPEYSKSAPEAPTEPILDTKTQKALDKPFGEDFGKVEEIKPLSLSEPDTSATPAKEVEPPLGSSLKKPSLSSPIVDPKTGLDLATGLPPLPTIKDIPESSSP